MGEISHRAFCVNTTLEGYAGRIHINLIKDEQNSN